MGLLDDKVVLDPRWDAGRRRCGRRAAGREGAAVAVTGRRADVGTAIVRELQGDGVAAPTCRPTSPPSTRSTARRQRRSIATGGSTASSTPPASRPAGRCSTRRLTSSTPTSPSTSAARSSPCRRWSPTSANDGAPGAIVNIISISEHAGQPYLAPYVAAKAGLAGLTRNVAHAHRWDRIRVNGLDIGWTDTEGEDIVQRSFHGADDDWRQRAAESLPMGRLGQADEIANFVVFLLSDSSGVVTGSVIDWDQTRHRRLRLTESARRAARADAAPVRAENQVTVIVAVMLGWISQW